MSGSAVTLGDFIYIVGGVGIRSIDGNTLLRYDPATDAWTTLAPLNQIRDHTAAVALKGLIYCLGGRWEGGELKTIEIYDPATNTWTFGPEMNVARAGFGASVLNDQILVAGGEIIVSGRYALDSVEVFDSQAGLWSLATPLPSPRHGVPAAVVDDTLYILAGSSQAAAAVNEPEVWAYRP
jgi:N-acetylneuraminic acid mutarotase